MKVAEASKAIENAQRDVNISFVNELALIFDRVGYRYSRRTRCSWNQMEFFKIQTRSCWRTLYQCRSLLLSV